MSTFTFASDQDHPFQEKGFRRAFLASIAIHTIILAVAAGMTLFRMTGNRYAPSYTVDLVNLPAAEPAKKVEPAKAEVKAPPKPAAEKKETKPPVKKKVVKQVVPPVPEKTQKEMKPSGGDEAARLERRKRIEELEKETRRLYENFTAAGGQAAGVVAPKPDATSENPEAKSTSGAVAGAKSAPNDIRFRAYYDRIWAKIKSSWVLPEGVTSRSSLLTVVGIRIAADGTIEQSWFEKKSGNDYYDQTTLRAIRRASPLPPLPEGLSNGPLEVGINFRYPD